MTTKKPLFNSVTAKENSVAVGGPNYGDITVNNGFQPAELKAILKEHAETTTRDEIDALLNSHIDEIVVVINKGQFLTAIDLLEKTFSRDTEKLSGKIKFRIRANIGICFYFLGNIDAAIENLLQAYGFAPSEPKAISNRVLALLLSGRFEDAYSFASKHLTSDPTNEVLAGYLLQSAKCNSEVTDPLELVPRDLRNSPHVLIGLIHFLQHRGKYGEWWETAHAASASYSDDDELSFLSAQANIEEVLNPVRVNTSLFFSPEEIEKLESSSIVYDKRIRKSFSGDAPFSEEDKSVLTGLLAIHHFLGNNKDFYDVFKCALHNLAKSSAIAPLLADIALQFAHYELAKEALELATETKELSFQKFVLAQVEGDKEYLATITDDVITTFPHSEQQVCRVLVVLARIEVAAGGH